MTNLTSRLAVRIRHIPEFEFSWSDTKPQRARSSLTIEYFLPSEVDSALLTERAVDYMMAFLVDNFTSLKKLCKFIPAKSPIHPVEKSDVVPMKILFKDEKYKTETLDILAQLLQDAGLSGNQQVCEGIQGSTTDCNSSVRTINNGPNSTMGDCI